MRIKLRGQPGARRTASHYGSAIVTCGESIASQDVVEVFVRAPFDQRWSHEIDYSPLRAVPHGAIISVRLNGPSRAQDRTRADGDR
jgi:hypothetical protein